jgi:cytochrome b subunit of formate dehydrogenase
MDTDHRNSPSVSRQGSTWEGVFARRMIFVVALFIPVLTVGASQTQPDDGPDRRCMQCHEQPHIAELGPDERLSMVGTWLDADSPPPAEEQTGTPRTRNLDPLRPELFVQHEDLGSSPHAELHCVECHVDSAQLPHPAVLNRATCAQSCHTEAWDAYSEGSHRDAYAHDDERAPTCVSCHGGHDMHAVDDRDAPQHRLNSLFLCGDCHSEHGPSQEGVESAARIDAYLHSAHAKAVTEAGLLWAANCVDCHGAHGVHKADDPRSTVHRTQIPGTCGSCHEGVSEIYEDSVHGQLLADGADEGPVCIDCHTAHSITRISSPVFVLDIINECGECHNTPSEDGTEHGTSYETYSRSYHGQVSTLGSSRAARCADCHGAHDILSLDDPDSRISESNRIATCSTVGCHPGANTKFVQFDPHANYRDRENYPILWGIWWYFIIVMTGVFTFFGLHTLLWFLRSLAHRLKHGPAPKHAQATTAIRRFTTLNRVNHGLVVLTFFGLTATGIPLVFAHQSWAGVLANVFGGIETAGFWHRIFATMLIVNFVLHFIGLARAFRRRKITWFRWLFGPGSLIPRWKDATDCFGMFRWFAGMGSLPRFDKWTYWEKFDYWAEVFGSMIIGGTGLLLWFPEIASKVFPGWVFNVAMVIHGYEALLAIGFIFTIHFFNTHVRPGAFPVDEVMFTGSVLEEELKEDRPEEYKRLVETGELDSLRVPADGGRHRPLFVAIAVLLVGFGLMLLTFILLGVLDAF